MTKMTALAKILDRVNLEIPLERVLTQVRREFSLGKISKYRVMRMGYSDVNIKIIAGRGKYLVKIFNKNKSHRGCQDYIRGLFEFQKAGVPTPVLLEGKNKNFLYKIKGQRKKAFLCVMEFFRGKNFNQISPTKKDLQVVTGFLTKIHRLKFPVGKNYDSWGTVNLLNEHRLKGKYLKTSDRELVEPIINEFKKINFHKLPKSIIHGDFHKDHVLKNRKGEYCVIDLDVMDENARILDMAIFLGFFAFSLKSVSHDILIYKYILRDYMRYIKLSKYEQRVLPILIMATYAIYLVRANYEKVVNHDFSSQTRGWLSFARRGLHFASTGLDT